MNYFDDYNDKDVIKEQAEIICLLTKSSFPPRDLLKIMRMDDKDIILMQAREMLHLRKAIEILKDKIRRAKTYIYEERGPLGNNPLRYNKQQLKIFDWILEIFE